MKFDSTFVPGKIILSGEYGGKILGHPSIVLPSPLGMTLDFEENETGIVTWKWDELADKKDWHGYIDTILATILKQTPGLSGVVTINNSIPLGKGMGSSTAVVIGLTKCLLNQFAKSNEGDPTCKQGAELMQAIQMTALEIENAVNPGHSGMDFCTIWLDKPIKFTKLHGPEVSHVSSQILQKAFLIDTGSPDQTTAELVEDILARADTLQSTSDTLAECSQRILEGESLLTIFPTHHKAQVELGVVPKEIQELIAEIESKGGAAKIIGAGSKTGGGGLVICILDNDELKFEISKKFPIIELIPEAMPE